MRDAARIVLSVAFAEHRSRQRVANTFKKLQSNAPQPTAESTVNSSSTPLPYFSSPSEHPVVNPVSQHTGIADINTAIADTEEWDPDALEADIQEEVSKLWSLAALNLEFANVPSSETPFTHPDPSAVLSFNFGYFALKTNKLCNTQFLSCESRICGYLREIETFPPDNHPESLEDSLWSSLTSLYRLKENQWNLKAYPQGRYGSMFNNLRHFARREIGSPGQNRRLIAALIIHIKFQTPVRKMRVILALLNWINSQRHISLIPKDISTIVSHYDLNPTTHSFLCCSKCFAIQPLTQTAVHTAREFYHDKGTFPICTSQAAHLSEPCHNPLWKIRRIGVKAYLVPVMKQVFQDLKSWLGRLLATPGFEDDLQSASASESDRISDFMNSPFIQTFNGSNNESFIENSSDLRLIMSFGADGFHAFGNTTRSGKANCTAIYLALLSLPPHLRYQKKYLFLVTVLSSSLTQDTMNHSLEQIVDQLLLFWTPGVCYMRTARHATGRRVFLAVIPVVCDAEAASQVSGTPHTAHHLFCCRCLLPRNTIDNLNPRTWPLRNIKEHKMLASLWRDSTVSGRDSIYNQHGLRWTELLRLPYFDVLHFVIFDKMHWGDLGLIPTHLKEFFKIDPSASGGEGLGVDSAHVEPADSTMRKLWEMIRLNNDLSQELKKLKYDLVWYTCYKLGLRTSTSSSKNKDTLIGRVVQWRNSVSDDEVPFIPPLNYALANFDDLLEYESSSEDGSQSSQGSQTSFRTARSGSTTAGVEIPDPPVVHHPFGGTIPVQKDAAYNTLKEQVNDVQGPSPSYHNTKDVLQALCLDLGIPFRRKDLKEEVIHRLRIYRRNRGTPPQLNIPMPQSNADPVQFLNNKRSFEQVQLSVSTVKSFGIPVLLQLCREYQIPPFQNPGVMEAGVEITAARMAKRLLLWRKENLESVIPPPSTPRAVLGGDVLQEIVNNMNTTVLPTHISTVRQNWALPGSGTMSADEWRVLCSIHLVVTLVRIWGENHLETSRHFQMLLNYLDLVHALHVFALHETSTTLQEYYLDRILKYLRGLIVLFPNVELKPNHHFAVHAAEDLKLMGPSHARETAVFERINHDLQLTDTNKILGQAEQTMLMAYCRQGNLELLLEHEFPDMDSIIDVLNAIKREDRRGTFSGTDFSAWATTQSSTTLIQLSQPQLESIIALLSARYHLDSSHWQSRVFRNALDLGSIASGRVTFSPSFRDRAIVFRDDCRIRAGFIIQVISHPHPHPELDSIEETVYLRVQTLEPIPSENDLYCKLNCGWLCHRAWSLDDQLVSLHDVVCHFARTELTINSQPVIHILPVVKVFHDNPSGRPTPV